MKKAIRLGLLAVAAGILAWYFLRPTGPTPPTATTGSSAGSVAMIDAGGHTCAITVDGAAYCWGGNSSGQLGIGSVRDQVHPERVANLAGARAVSAGQESSCALGAQGEVWCWGKNSSGQVGDGTRKERRRPVQVGTLGAGVTAVSVGEAHACAITASGALRCWGANNHGQVGDGSATRRTRPVQVTGLDRGVKAVSAGKRHTCAVTATGAVRCWGENRWGQLGDGTHKNRSKPVVVKGLDAKAVAVTVGETHSCALTESGAVRCWGDGRRGQLGFGSRGDSDAPVEVVGLDAGITGLSAGAAHTCAVRQDGTLWCWGRNEPGGALGDGTLEDRLIPVQVPGIPEVASVSAGQAHTCALTATGVAKCWGSNKLGQLGDGTTTNRLPGDVVFD